MAFCGKASLIPFSQVYLQQIAVVSVDTQAQFELLEFTVRLFTQGLDTMLLHLLRLVQYQDGIRYFSL